MHRHIKTRSKAFHKGDLKRAQIAWDADLRRSLKPRSAKHWSRRGIEDEAWALPEVAESVEMV